jgi:hypothetical protein
MEEFEYDKQESYEGNFRRWYAMNSKERDIYGEPKLSQLEAEAVFADLYDVSYFRVQRA